MPRRDKPFLRREKKIPQFTQSPPTLLLTPDEALRAHDDASRTSQAAQYEETQRRQRAEEEEFQRLRQQKYVEKQRLDRLEVEAALEAARRNAIEQESLMQRYQQEQLRILAAPPPSLQRSKRKDTLRLKQKVLEAIPMVKKKKPVKITLPKSVQSYLEAPPQQFQIDYTPEDSLARRDYAMVTEDEGVQPQETMYIEAPPQQLQIDYTPEDSLARRDYAMVTENEGLQPEQLMYIEAPRQQLQIGAPERNLVTVSKPYRVKAMDVENYPTLEYRQALRLPAPPTSTLALYEQGPEIEDLDMLQ
jgi:hypothetical protein